MKPSISNAFKLITWSSGLNFYGLVNSKTYTIRLTKPADAEIHRQKFIRLFWLTRKLEGYNPSLPVLKVVV
jgi:predicted transcriptional regulator of viral defense system